MQCTARHCEATKHSQSASQPASQSIRPLRLTLLDHSAVRCKYIRSLPLFCGALQAVEKCHHFGFDSRVVGIIYLQHSPLMISSLSSQCEAESCDCGHSNCPRQHHQPASPLHTIHPSIHPSIQLASQEARFLPFLAKDVSRVHP